ncbi:response regulator [Vibrio kyushuensis]|uniref:hybrid sensor histidine kinase/response regulator n=1 Tax=Vibrio kyushuensis TaxID=2910249 RepID=UPI003D0B83E5
MMSMNALRNMGLRNKLLLTFLILSIAPMLLISSIFYVSFVSSTEEQVYDNLLSVAQSKQGMINQHMDRLKQQSTHYSETDFVKYAMSRFYGFPYAFGLISEDSQFAAQELKSHHSRYGDFKKLPAKASGVTGSYQQVHDRFDTGFSQFIQKSDFSDLYLIDESGLVLYNFNKGHYFAADLTSESYQKSPLGIAFTKMSQQLREHDGAIHGKIDPEFSLFHDFAFDANEGQMVSYIIKPLEHHSQVAGYIAFALSSDSIDSLIHQPVRLGEQSEVYVINRQLNPISKLMHGSELIGNVDPRLIHRYTFDTPTIEQALHGFIGVMPGTNYINTPVLSAYSFVDIGDVRWAIVAEQSQLEAQARSLRFGYHILLIGTLFILTVAAFVYWLSRSLTYPLQSLMAATESITYGGALQPISGKHRKDEIGRLASRFDVMAKAVRRQLDVIKNKNGQLEEHVDLINEQNVALRQADKIKDEFLANTSHELKTPLTGVIGITESLLQGVAGALNEHQEQQLSMVKNSAQRLAYLVDDLLDFHKIENNQLRVSPSAVDVNRCSETIIAITQHMVGDKPVKLSLTLPDTPMLVFADITRLEQVLYNLLNNAIKYTDDGEVNLLISNNENKTVTFSIIDSGIGITESEHSTIFDPFVQIDGSITRIHNGSGLGLAIAFQLVKLMDGKLSLKSKVGEGSCFTFTLPLFDPELEHHKSAVVEHLTRSSLGDDGYPRQNNAPYNAGLPLCQMNNSNTDGFKVVVVDDEVSNLQVLNNQLTYAGYEVTSFSDGTEAINYLKENSADIAILDVMMPQISGFEVCQELKKHKTTQALPILLLTAKSQTKDLLQAFESGADDYLTKPFMQQELLARVSHLLKANQADKKLEENEQLKIEVAERIESESSLINEQSRMKNILEQIDDALISINDSNEITYTNASALALTGNTLPQLIGSNIQTVLSNKAVAELKLDAELNTDSPDGAPKASTIDIQSSLGSITTVQAQVLVTNKEPNLERHIILSKRMPLPSSKTTEPKMNSESDFRKNLVVLMNDSIALWQDGTGQSKIHLAEKSRIWSVYLDRSSAQTRTMDKYFLEQTLPKKPRWRDVVRTATYVIHHVDKEVYRHKIAHLNHTSNQIKAYLSEK